MRPIQANSDFYQNRSTANATVTLTLHNPNSTLMSVLDGAGGTVITTLPPGDTVTVTFSVNAGGQLHSDVSGAALYHGIVF